MNDFICTGFSEVWGMGKEQNIQNENTSLQPDLYTNCLPSLNANSAPKTV